MATMNALVARRLGIAQTKDGEEKKEGGFTLIELLVVVVIIGVLVAIAIPIFINQRESALARAVESDVRNSIPVLESYYADNNSYPATPTGTPTAGAPIDLDGTGKYTITISENVVLEYTNNGTSYEITGSNPTDLAGRTWSYDSSVSGVITED